MEPIKEHPVPKLNLPNLSILFIAVAVFRIAYLVVDRLYFSSIAAIPGPRLAAVMFWYEFYYDAILGGQYTFHIRKLHERYGPVIRINPVHVHVYDPDCYDLIYSGNLQRRDKWHPQSEGLLGLRDGMVHAPSHDVHRKRRAILDGYFSRKSINQLSPFIRSKVKQMLGRFRQAAENGEILNMNHVFSAFANDIVLEFGLGRNDNRLGHPTFDPSFYSAGLAGAWVTTWDSHIPWLQPLLLSLPPSILGRFSPHLATLLKIMKDVQARVNDVKADTRSDENSSKRNIIAVMWHNPKIGPEDKTDARLFAEAFTNVVAGTMTTAWTMVVGFFYVNSSPAILARLREELSALDNPLEADSYQLEKLPYLDAVIKESLRLSYGGAGRLPRINPEGPTLLPIDGTVWSIPAGVPMSMTNVHMVQNPAIFPDPLAFKPERWLVADPPDRYLVPFSKGTRGCIGRSLAQVELLFVFASVFRFDHELFETTVDDVDVRSDWQLAMPKKGSKGVRASVMGLE